jgi:hypothetical protein
LIGQLLGGLGAGFAALHFTQQQAEADFQRGQTVIGRAIEPVLEPRRRLAPQDFAVRIRIRTCRRRRTAPPCSLRNGPRHIRPPPASCRCAHPVERLADDRGCTVLIAGQALSQPEQNTSRPLNRPPRLA